MNFFKRGQENFYFDYGMILAQRLLYVGSVCRGKFNEHEVWARVSRDAISGSREMLGVGEYSELMIADSIVEVISF